MSEDWWMSRLVIAVTSFWTEVFGLLATPLGTVYFAVPMAEPIRDDGFEAKALVIVEKAVFCPFRTGLDRLRVVAEFFIILGFVPSC